MVWLEKVGPFPTTGPLCVFCFSVQVLFNPGSDPHIHLQALGEHFRLNELYTRILIISSSPLCLLAPLFLETLLVGNGQILLESDRQKAPCFMGDPRCQYRKNFALGQGLNYPGDSCLDKGGQVLGTPVKVLTVVWPLPSSSYP